MAKKVQNPLERNPWWDRSVYKDEDEKKPDEARQRLLEMYRNNQDRVSQQRQEAIGKIGKLPDITRQPINNNPLTTKPFIKSDEEDERPPSEKPDSDTQAGEAVGQVGGGIGLQQLGSAGWDWLTGANAATPTVTATTGPTVANLGETLVADAITTGASEGPGVLAAAEGATAAGETGILGTAGNYAATYGPYAAAAVAAYNLYNSFKDPPAQSDYDQVEEMLQAGLNFQGTDVYASWFGSGKGGDQRLRDAYRSHIQEYFPGLVNDNWELTLPDGTVFNLGMDGGARLQNVDGSERQYHDIDWEMEGIGEYVGMANPIGALLTGASGDRWQDAVSWITNALTTTKGGGVIENTRSIYEQAGLDRNTAYQGILDLTEMGRLTEGERDSMLASIDKVFGVMPDQAGGAGGYGPQQPQVAGPPPPRVPWPNQPATGTVPGSYGPPPSDQDYNTIVGGYQDTAAHNTSDPVDMLLNPTDFNTSGGGGLTLNPLDFQSSRQRLTNPLNRNLRRF